MALEFASTNGIITCNGERVHLKGTNWFGLETDTFSLHGLWCVSFDSILGFIKDNQFNALRIPISVECVEKLSTDKIKSIDSSCNPDLADMTIEAFIDHLLVKCAEAGILIMFDMHLLKASAPIPELWYSSDVSEQRYIGAWKTLVSRYSDHWNFFACDLNNEPHGAATWGDGGDCDWRAAAQRIGNAILALCPRLLIFVEGIDGRDMDDSWWGGYLALAHPEENPVYLSIPDRLVYSPHVYGPDVFFKEAFKTACFPSNMTEIWRRQWSFIKLDAVGPAVVIGEWGGKAQPGTPDLIWQRALAEYLAENDITDAFYWCVNPNSGDTEGLLGDDWKTPAVAKLEIIAVACPAPTSFVGGQPHTPSIKALPLPWPSVMDGAVPTPIAGASMNHDAEPTASSGVQVPQEAGQAPAVVTAPSVTEGSFDPTSITVVAHITNRWQDAGLEHVQHDVVITNTSAAPVGAMVRVNVDAAEVVKVWNLDSADDGAYKLPSWLLDAGGLQPGASFNFGGITRGAAVITIVCCN